MLATTPQPAARVAADEEAPMLRIAVPNKGSLSETAVEMLVEAGYAGRRDPRALTVADPRNGVEFFYLRPRDIATYVGSGALDVGITGRDLLLDSGSEAVEIQSLDFGDSTFRFAAVPGTVHDLADLEGRRIATSYPGLVGAFLAERGVTAQLIRLDGAVESAVLGGVLKGLSDFFDKRSEPRVFPDLTLPERGGLTGSLSQALLRSVARAEDGSLNLARAPRLGHRNCLVRLARLALTPGLEPLVSVG